MSGDLTALIRLHQWRLDEKRRALADLEGLAERLTEEIGRLDEQVRRETAAVANEDLVTVDIGAFLAACRDRRKRLCQSRDQVNREIEVARSDISECYRELKKYELVQEERDRRAQDRLKRREVAMYDEIGITRHARREKG